MTNDLLTWDDVSGADSYIIVIDGIEFTSYNNKFDLTDFSFGKGKNIIKVQAIASEEKDNSKYAAFAIYNDYNKDELRLILADLLAAEYPHWSDYDSEIDYILTVFVDVVTDETGVYYFQLIEFIDKFFIKDAEYAENDAFVILHDVLKYFINNSDFSDTQNKLIIYNYTKFLIHYSLVEDTEWETNKIVDLNYQINDLTELLDNYEFAIDERGPIAIRFYELRKMQLGFNICMDELEDLYYSDKYNIYYNYSRPNYYYCIETYYDALVHNDTIEINHWEFNYPWILEAYETYKEYQYYLYDEVYDEFEELKSKNNQIYWETFPILEEAISNELKIYTLNRKIANYENRIVYINNKNEMAQDLLDFVILNQDILKDSIDPLYRTLKSSYASVLTSFNELFFNESLTIKEKEIIKNNLVNSMINDDSLLNKKEINTIKNLLQRINIFLFNDLQVSDELFGDNKHEVFASILHAIDLFTDIYNPSMLAFKEVLLTISLEDIVTITDTIDVHQILKTYQQYENCYEIVLNIKQQLQDNSIFTHNRAIINQKIESFIKDRKIPILPILIQDTYDIQEEMAEFIASLITDNIELINAASSEILNIVTESGLIKVYLQVFVNENNYFALQPDYAVPSKHINYEYLLSLSSEDLDKLVNLTQTIFVDVYEYLYNNNGINVMTPQEFAVEFDSEFLYEVLIDFYSLYLSIAEVGDLQKLEENPDYINQALISYVDELINFYDNTLSNDIDNLQRKIDNYLDDNPRIEILLNYLDFDRDFLHAFTDDFTYLRTTLFKINDINPFDMTLEDEIFLHYVLDDLRISDNIHEMIKLNAVHVKQSAADYFKDKLDALNNEGKQYNYEEWDEKYFNGNDLVKELRQRGVYINITEYYNEVIIDIYLGNERHEINIQFYEDGSYNIFL